MSKIIIYTLLALLVITVGMFLISCSSNPLRKSEEQIRESIIKLTPIGTSMDAVLKIVENHEGWQTLGVNYERGFTRQSPEDSGNGLGYSIIGEKAIGVNIGKYLDGIFYTQVSIHWGFDENSNLIDIWVHKTTAGF